jgi:hypothetical protein
MSAFDDDFRKTRTLAVLALRKRHEWLRKVSCHFEFLTQADDIVLIEEIAPGRFREFSLRRGTVRTRGLRWYERCEPLIAWVHERLDHWEQRRDIRRRKERHEKLRQAFGHRRPVPAFTCRLCSKHLR